MEIEILVVPDCPNERVVAGLLRQALDDLGMRGVGFTVRVIDEPAEAERIGFTGSPTIWIDKRDPFAEAGRPPGLACRIYRTPEGLAGVPGLGELREVLRAAAIPRERLRPRGPGP